MKKKVRNEKAYKQTLVVRDGGTDQQPKFVRIGLAPGLNRIDEEDWARIMEDEKARAYAFSLRDEGVLDFDDDDDEGEDDTPKKTSKKSSKGKPKKGKGKGKSSDIDGL